MPHGARFTLPIPFLLDHEHDKVVGEVYRAEVEAKGIRFWARIQKIAEPGAARDLVDYAWSLVKHGLRKVVSVGFLPLEYEPIAGGGLRFTAWEWIELSAVGVAAQPEARITGTKAAKRAPVVRLGNNQGHAGRVVSLNAGRVGGKLKVRTPPRNKPGEPFKIRRIVRTAPRVVKLTEADREAGRIAHESKQERERDNLYLSDAAWRRKYGTVRLGKSRKSVRVVQLDKPRGAR